MNTKSKIIIIICSIFAVLFLVMYIVLGFFKPVVVDELVYPTSGLSQSVFDSQNMNYVQTPGYEGKHYFNKVPYTIDTAQGPRANIGSGSFYNSEPYYFYYSEVLGNENLVDVLKSEMTDILSITAEEKDTTVEVLSEESGYINGTSATFYVLRVAAGQVDSYMCLYRMHINHDIYKSDYDLLAGVMSKNMEASTDSLNNLYTLANASVYTMQFSREIEDRLLDEEQKRLEAEAKAKEEQEKVEDEGSEENAESVENAENAEGTVESTEKPTENTESTSDLFKEP